MADLLNIGKSGLMAHQTALETVGHNIANANVDGYSRQRTVQATGVPQFTGAGWQGNGVITSDIQRVSDQFLTNQFRADAGAFSGLDNTVASLQQIESMLGDDQSGLNTAMQQFFSAIQAASNDPTSLPARQQVLSQAQALEGRLNDLTRRIDSQIEGGGAGIATTTESINRLTSNIAELNATIAAAYGQSGASPNDLLDKRDILINELSELVSVTTTVQDGHQVNVFIGDGQSVVLGNKATMLSTAPSKTDSAQQDILIGNAVITSGISGGTLGSMLALNGGVLKETQNTLGQIALGLADAVNRQQALGVDLNGHIGNAVFTDINSDSARYDRAIIDDNNSPLSNGAIGVDITDASQLTTNDYVLSFNGPSDNSYAISHAATGEVISAGEFSSTRPAKTISIDGFSISLDAGNFSVGDSVLIQPTKTGAQSFNVQMTRPEELAFAQAIRTDSHVGNSGTGKISEGEVLNVYSADGSSLLADFSAAKKLTPPLLVRFTSESTYSVFDNTDPSNPVALVPALNDVPFVPGTENQVFPTNPQDPGFRGYQVSIGGSPKLGDEFEIEFNSHGVGDNRNAIALADLQVLNTLDNGSRSYANAYSGLVQKIGGMTSGSMIERDAAQALMNQSRNARDSVSGVNLDEEAAKLIQFEHAYNASAQVIQVARTIFDSLLSAVN